jgi:hypothetical protein
LDEIPKVNIMHFHYESSVIKVLYVWIE